MTDKGLALLKAWLMTQVPDFPGDREMDIRAVKSKVAVVGPRGGPDDPSQPSSSSRFHTPRHSHSSRPEGAGTDYRSGPVRSQSRVGPYPRSARGGAFRSVSPVRRFHGPRPRH